MQIMADSAGVRLFFKFMEERRLDLSSIKGAQAAYHTSRTAERIPAALIIDLLEEASHVLRDDTFGIKYAQKVNLRRLGPMGLLWEHSNNLAEVLRTTQQYLHVMNEAVMLKIEWEHDETAIAYTLSPISYNGARQFTEALLVCVVRLIREGLGENWVPSKVELTHSAPADRTEHVRFFRSKMEFKSNRNAVLLKSDDLLRPFLKSDLEVLDVLKRQLERMDEGLARDFVTRVDSAAASLLIGGRLSLTSVARQLGIGPRTLQRRLKDHGVTLSAIVTALRTRRAIEYFDQEPYPRLAHLAQLLGYSDVSTTSRFLKSVRRAVATNRPDDTALRAVE